MANPARRLSTNVAGDFFVDDTCINCDTCRQLAPGVFAERGAYSAVVRQPPDPAERRAALRAVLACPTGSIGAGRTNDPKPVVADFPLHLDGPVFYAGFNSPASYGANSYVVRDPTGNWLVDSPKFLPPLVRRLEELGGLRWIFLTHRDDVADARRYAEHFGAVRIIHRADLAAQPDAEWVLDGREPIVLTPEARAVPVPGHTRGHAVLLYKHTYLFSGDHLAWDREWGRLTAFRHVCWYSWPEQTASMARLLDECFAWVLPGHGQRHHLPAETMHAELAALVERMRAA